MTFYPTDRLALFIDGANLYSAAKGLGFDIDYRKLLEEVRKRGVLVRAYYYTALVEEQDYSPIRPLVDWLDYNGFTLVTKSAREYTDAQGRKRWRGDMDVDLAVDMMEIAERGSRAVEPVGMGRAVGGAVGDEPGADRAVARRLRTRGRQQRRVSPRHRPPDAPPAARRDDARGRRGRWPWPPGSPAAAAPGGR